MEQNNQRAQKKRKKIEKKTTKINEQKLYIKLLSTIYAKNWLSLSQVELGEMALLLADPKSKLKIFLYLLSGRYFQTGLAVAHAMQNALSTTLREGFHFDVPGQLY